MTFKLTPEQEAVIEAVARKGGPSIDVDALAGAAKSTTLRHAAARLTTGRNVALAFNVPIKEALAKVLPSNFDVLTMNGLGHRAWMKFTGAKIKVETDKAYRICRGICENAGFGGDSLKEARETLQALLNAARSHGLVTTGPFPVKGKGIIPDTPEGWLDLAEIADIDINASNVEQWMELGRAALVESCTQAFAGVIDFADQIYMPTMFGGAFTRYERVLVDEAQDLSPLNHIQLQRCTGGPMLLVGDERQSIYAFRGADSDSIPKLRTQFKTQTLELTTTFRCSKNVVKNALWRAPKMRPADWAPDGQVKDLGEWSLNDITPGSFVICRNNAPLVSLGFKMLAAGIPITFQGADTAKSVISFILKIAGRDLEMSAGLFFGRLDKWLADELREAEDRRSPSRASRATDKAEMCRALPGKTVAELVEALKRIFAQTDGIITLMSGHKSKGLEAETVFHLDSHLVPSRFATTERAMTQERNLQYVIETRPKLNLFRINREKLT